MQQIVSIQYLRGFAAALVLMFHVGFIMPQTGIRFSLGTLGVDIFFVISGFIIWVTARDMAPFEFMKRRLIRLVPLYWTLTLIVALGTVFLGGVVGLRELVLSLAFIFDLPKGNAIWPKPILSVGWTLNLEMFFYSLMAIALFAPKRARLPILFSVISILVAIGFLLPGGTDPRLLMYTSNFLAEFLIGVMLGVLWVSGKIPVFNRRNVCFIVSGIFVLSLLPFLIANRLFASGGTVALIVLWFLMAEPLLRKAPVAVLRTLGDVSYSLYLTHLQVILVCKSAASAGLLPNSGFGLAAVTVLLSLLVAYAVHFWFERPVHGTLTARTARAQTTARHDEGQNTGSNRQST